jgi:hypothetical protein
MATEHDPIPETRRPAASHAQPGRPDDFLKTTPPRKPESRGGAGTLLGSAILGLLAGGAGAWVYDNYLKPALARQQPQSEKLAATAPGPGDAAAGRLDDMSRRLEELQARVDKLPKPSPLPDLEPINQKLTSVEDLSHKVEAQQTRFEGLPDKIDQNARKLTAMMADLEGFKNQLTSLRTDVQEKTSAAAKPASPKAAAASSGAGEVKSEQPAEDDFARGIDQFQKKQYKGASETFDRLTQARPDDARVLYFAALARGFATSDWKGQTEQLANRGVDLERAGHPAKVEIDAAFSGLTAETGRDWLAFYRRRAAAPADRASR